MRIIAAKRLAISSFVLLAILLLCVVVLNGCGTSRAAGMQNDGKLAPCPSSPNCVCSSYQDDGHAVAPITYTGTITDAHRRLMAALKTLPRIAVVTELTPNASQHYVHVTATTLIMRFTDDVEFIIDDNKKHIDVRSLSRVGYSDLGVNRRRVEAIRTAFENAQ